MKLNATICPVCGKTTGTPGFNPQTQAAECEHCQAPLPFKKIVLTPPEGQPVAQPESLNRIETSDGIEVSYPIEKTVKGNRNNINLQIAAAVLMVFSVIGLMGLRRVLDFYLPSGFEIVLSVLLLLFWSVMRRGLMAMLGHVRVRSVRLEVREYPLKFWRKKAPLIPAEIQWLYTRPYFSKIWGTPVLSGYEVCAGLRNGQEYPLQNFYSLDYALYLEQILRQFLGITNETLLAHPETLQIETTPLRESLSRNHTDCPSCGTPVQSVSVDPRTQKMLCSHCQAPLPFKRIVYTTPKNLSTAKPETITLITIPDGIELRCFGIKPEEHPRYLNQFKGTSLAVILLFLGLFIFYPRSEPHASAVLIGAFLLLFLIWALVAWSTWLFTAHSSIVVQSGQLKVQPNPQLGKWKAVQLDAAEIGGIYTRLSLHRTKETVLLGYEVCAGLRNGQEYSIYDFGFLDYAFYLEQVLKQQLGITNEAFPADPETLRIEGWRKPADPCQTAQPDY